MPCGPAAAMAPPPPSSRTRKKGTGISRFPVAHPTSAYGCTTVMVPTFERPTPRMSGRYMSSTSGGGTV